MRSRGHAGARHRLGRHPCHPTHADDAPSPSDTAGEREEARQLYAFVEQLDEDARQTVHLHYYQGLSLSETAEALGIATSTVKYRLRNALDSLRAGTNETKLSIT